MKLPSSLSKLKSAVRAGVEYASNSFSVISADIRHGLSNTINPVSRRTRVVSVNGAQRLEVRQLLSAVAVSPDATLATALDVSDDDCKDQNPADSADAVCVRQISYNVPVSTVPSTDLFPDDVQAFENNAGMFVDMTAADQDKKSVQQYAPDTEGSDEFFRSIDKVFAGNNKDSWWLDTPPVQGEKETLIKENPLEEGGTDDKEVAPKKDVPREGEGEKKDDTSNAEANIQPKAKGTERSVASQESDQEDAVATDAIFGEDADALFEMLDQLGSESGEREGK